MQTLTYGFQKPQTGDKGSVFFPGLEDDLQQLNDHTHNGSNSSLIPSSSVTAVTQSVAHAGWGSSVGGLYSQVVSMPAGITWGTKAITFIDATANRVLLLSHVQVTSNTFRVYCNDPTIDLTVLYT